MRKWFSGMILATGFIVVCLAAVEAMLRGFDFTPEGYNIPRYYPGIPGDLEPDLIMNEAIYPTYRISSTPQGTRGLRPFSPEKPPTSARVLCLGDSFTYSAGVDDNDAYPEQLAQELERRYPGKKVDVINAGIPMWGLLDEIDYYLEKGRLLHPDVVVLQTYSNCFQSHLRGIVHREVCRKFFVLSNRSWFSHYFSWSKIYQWYAATYPTRAGISHESRPLSRKVGPCEGFDPVLDPFRFCPQPEEISFMSDRDKLLGEADTPAFSRVTGAYFTALGAFRDVLAAEGVQLLLVEVPDRWQVSAYRNAINVLWTREMSLLGIDAIDVVSTFRASLFRDGINPYKTNGDDHCSLWGYHLLAQSVADALRISENLYGLPNVTVRAPQALFDYASPARVRLWVDKKTLLRSEAPDGISARVEQAHAVAVEEETSVQINTLQALPGEGEAGEVVLRIDCAVPLKRLDLRLPRKVANDPAGISSATTWISTDRSSWRLIEHARSDTSGKAGTYEQFAILEAPFEESSPSTVWLKIRLTGDAAIYAERPEVVQSERNFELYLYPAPRIPRSP